MQTCTHTHTTPSHAVGITHAPCLGGWDPLPAQGGVGAPALCNPALSHTPGTPNVSELPTLGTGPTEHRVGSCGEPVLKGTSWDPQDISSAKIHFAVWTCDDKIKVNFCVSLCKIISYLAQLHNR